MLQKHVLPLLLLIVIWQVVGAPGVEVFPTGLERDCWVHPGEHSQHWLS